MNVFSLGLLFFLVLAASSAQAQYKAPSQYFRKDFPAPAPGQPAVPAPGTENPPPARAAGIHFKDLPVQTPFYFPSDTNRTYLWTKISATAAKNAKNGVTQTIAGETQVRR